jgi:predicted transport protein
MSDIQLFRYDPSGVSELSGKAATIEKELQSLIEANMEAFLGVRFLASEYSTGKTHRGRIDSLGLDENNCPVIVEYKRHSNENVINQGLFYLDWLQDHQAEFRWLVMDKLGKETAECIDWLGTRLLCIAADFNKYDQHAVQQINRNISLIRYKLFSEDLLMFELVNAITEKLLQPTMFADIQPNKQAKLVETATTERHDLHQNRIAMASPELLALYQEVCDYSESLGDDVQRKELKFYTAFQKIKNFVSLQIWAPLRDPQLRLYLKLNPREVELSQGFIHDVTDKGHWGTGNLEIIIRTKDDLDKSKLFIERSYQEN